MLIDTHCHLNDSEAFPIPELAIKEAKMVGVDKIVVVGVDLETSELALNLANKYENIYAIVGWHPNNASKYVTKNLKQIENLAKNPKTVAIGEIGFDFYWEYATFEQQQTCLIDQLELSLNINKPVVFHCRNAYVQLLDILEKQPYHKFLFHCFAGDLEDAQRCMRFGAWFGINGPITYKNSHNLKEIIKILPKDKLVIETDSPWLTPQPFRGKPNRPCYLSYINKALAAVLEITDEECAIVTTQNAQDFFNFKIKGS